jgi:hypothetical protein
MAKVITMGEIMLRLSTPGFQRIIQSDSFDVNYGGGEANVAVSLANYGHDAYYVTKVPRNAVGDSAVASLKRYNVNCDYLARGGERLGIYYLETGASMRASNVIYDRAHSSIAEAEPSDFDFDQIFKDADWFHFTGITPAISDKAAILTEEALKAAKINFIGHTEMLAALTNTNDPLTMFQVYGLRVFFLTRHVSLRKACDLAKKEKIVEYLFRCDEALRNLGLDKRLILYFKSRVHQHLKEILNYEENVDLSCNRRAARLSSRGTRSDFSIRRGENERASHPALCRRFRRPRSGNGGWKESCSIYCRRDESCRYHSGQ